MDQIADNLYVGSMYDLSPTSDSPVDPVTFQNVISLGDDQTPYTTHHYPLDNFDSEGYESFEEAVTTVRECIQKGERTFVHCTAGVSRSVAVTTTALAVEQSMSFDEKFEEIKEIRDQSALHPNLQKSAKQYVESHSKEDINVESDGELLDESSEFSPSTDEKTVDEERSSDTEENEKEDDEQIQTGGTSTPKSQTDNSDEKTSRDNSGDTKDWKEQMKEVTEETDTDDNEKKSLIEKIKELFR